MYAHNVAAAALRAVHRAGRAVLAAARARALLVAEGWPLDALALAGAALHNTRVPKVVVEAEAAGAATAAAAAAAAGGGGAAAPLDLDLDESLDESLPFDASGLPVYVTLATIGAHFVADCGGGAARGGLRALARPRRARPRARSARRRYGVQLTPLADMLQTARPRRRPRRRARRLRLGRCGGEKRRRCRTAASRPPRDLVSTYIFVYYAWHALRSATLAAGELRHVVDHFHGLA